MFDFQILRAAFLVKNGISQESDEIQTTEDLDALYAKMKKPE